MATEEHRKQVRLALVVEGGVSLAVWMSGMVHEVDLLRRAGAPGRPDLGTGGSDAEAMRRRFKATTGAARAVADARA